MNCINRLFLPFIIIITITSCGKSNYYHICYDEDNVIIRNNAGSITFPKTGKVSIEGRCVDGELMPGSILTMVENNEDRLQTVIFEQSLQDSSIQISTKTVYKRDRVIDYDGIIGECEGDIGFERDRNVFVCGTPVLVGYTDKTKKQFAICPEYGSLTPFHSKLEEKYYTTKTVKAGDTLSTKLVILNNDECPVRLLCQPDGYRATFTIASHADIAHAPVTRAVLWGTSDTTSIDYGKKGMLSNGIVGTMSVFSKHTEQYRESEALEVSYFKRLVDVAYRQGMEICPHTISYNPDKREDVIDYLPVLDTNYHCRNWIDHLLRRTNISSGLHSAGCDTASGYYIMDVLHEYGYQYCWSYVDTPDEKETPDDQLWKGHYMFPKHLVYQNERLAFPDGTCMWQYKNAWEMLAKMIVKKEYDPVQFMEGVIDNCGVWTDHCYLSGDWNKLYEQDKKKREYRILPKLETFFEYLAEKKKTSELWNPTMSEFCDYMVKLENVSISRLSRGVYQITNNNSEPVSCSFYYKGDGKLVLNGEPMNIRNSEAGNVYYGMVEVGGGNLLIIN